MAGFDLAAERTMLDLYLQRPVMLGQRTALQSMRLQLEGAQWVSVVGPNGAGKSTLLKAMAGLIPTEGSVQWGLQDLKRMAPRQRASLMAWQGEMVVDDQWLVRDVVLLGREPHRAALRGVTAHDAKAVTSALRAMDVESLADRPMGQLSAGERQRVLLARTWAVQASVTLFDEPVSNLDPPHQVTWRDTVLAQARAGQLIVSVLHDLNLALSAHRVVVLHQGALVHVGLSGDAATHEAVSRVFDHKVTIDHPASTPHARQGTPRVWLVD
jgi:iron complex transport system ATP-binding protein